MPLQHVVFGGSGHHSRWAGFLKPAVFLQQTLVAAAGADGRAGGAGGGGVGWRC